MALIESKRVTRLIAQVEKNRKNCHFDDVRNLLLAVGCTERNSGSSHHIFKCPGHMPISVPKQKPVKEHYVDEVLQLVYAIIGGT